MSRDFIVTNQNKDIVIVGNSIVEAQISDADTTEGKATKLLEMTFKIKNADRSYYSLGTATLFKALMTFTNAATANITSTTNSVVAKIDWVDSQKEFSDTFKLADNDDLIGKYLSFQVTDSRAGTFSIPTIEKLIPITHSDTPAELAERVISLKSSTDRIEASQTVLSNAIGVINLNISEPFVR